MSSQTEGGVPNAPHPDSSPVDGGKLGGGAFLARRRRITIAVVAGSVVFAMAGVAAASYVKSPAQAAADTAPPPRDVLTAPVERRELSQTLVTRGKVVASQTVDVVQGGGPAGDGVGRTVVTKVNVKTGDAVTFGHVLLEVSGRPVFALPGRIPVYRDLAPGAHGEDVAQLQRALTTLGLRWKPDSAGIFGDGTQRALAAFYASIGYEPVRLRQAPGDAGRATAGFRSTTLPESRAPAPQAMSTGITLPMSEVFYLNSPPARIDSLTAKVGSGVKDSLMTVSAGELSVDGSLAPSQKGLVRPGQKVQILSETTGQEATGSVTSVATAPSAPKRDDPQSGQSFAMRVTPDKQLPVGFAGQEVRLTVTAASSGGKALLVPSAAISSGADARTTVTVRSAHGRQHRVEVRTGMSGDGYVQVTPVGAGSLAAGDQVVVGLKTGTQRAG